MFYLKADSRGGLASKLSGQKKDELSRTVIFYV
jgi:hypothetical protein